MDILNLNECFNDLEFTESTHTYTRNGQTLPSVSKKIKTFYEPFNAKKIAPLYARKHGLKTADVLKMWAKTGDVALTKGTEFHDWGEQHAKYIKVGIKPVYEDLDYMKKNGLAFWDELDPKYEIAALELRMYHEEFSYAGTADIILRNTETGNYVIADYKTNKDLFKNYKGKTMKMPFEQMLDCPMSKYEIQLSYYQMMLEAQGVTVEDRWIIHVDLEDTYKIYKTPDHTSTLIEYHEHKELYDWLS